MGGVEAKLDLFWSTATDIGEWLASFSGKATQYDWVGSSVSPRDSEPIQTLWQKRNTAPSGNQTQPATLPANICQPSKK
jgi:hypothetical protein